MPLLWRARQHEGTRLHEAPGYDLLILDLHLTDTHGLESLTAVREAFPGLPVIIFSADDSSATIVSAYEHGVQGYVAKNEQIEFGLRLAGS